MWENEINFTDFRIILIDNLKLTIKVLVINYHKYLL